MAQTTSGFPWTGQSQEPNPVLSEKNVNSGNSTIQFADQRIESNLNGQPQLQKTSTEKQTEKQQKHSSVRRKRAISLKASAPVIPQTREELDEHLSYGTRRQYNVRTIPPWVRDAEEDDIVDDVDDATIDSPHAALVAQHNSSPANTKRTGRQERTGLQDPYPMSSGITRAEKTSRWITFARSSAYPRENFDNEKVDTEWLNENFTDYSRPWLESHGNDQENDSNRFRGFKRKRQVWYKRMQFTILRNPFVPLAIRFTVILFAAMAIGLGASIYHESGIVQECIAQSPRTPKCLDLIGGNGQVDYYSDPSGLMAVIVDAIAIIYTFYITYDEYFSKPLGLRPAKAKVRLVLLDLFFIVFQSANLSLAFESLTVGEGACFVGSEPSTSYRFDRICDRAQALSAVLLVSLVAWLLTFSVSILRLVERLN